MDDGHPSRRSTAPVPAQSSTSVIDKVSSNAGGYSLAALPLAAHCHHRPSHRAAVHPLAKLADLGRLQTQCSGRGGLFHTTIPLSVEYHCNTLPTYNNSLRTKCTTARQNAHTTAQIRPRHSSTQSTAEHTKAATAQECSATSSRQEKATIK
jgi:hypothetical protein